MVVQPMATEPRPKSFCMVAQKRCGFYVKSTSNKAARCVPSVLKVPWIAAFLAHRPP